MAPLWAGVAPFAMSFAVLARSSGFSSLETQALSMLVFAGSAQLAFVTLAASGAGGFAVILTAAMLNLRHVLYGLSLSGRLPRPARPPRWLVAAFLTDESYGLAVREFRAGRGSAGFLLGASVSLYIVFAVATLAGAQLGGRVGDLDRLGLAFVFPLSFLALLIPLLRTRIDIVVMVVAGGIAIALGSHVDGGTRVLIATIGSAALGAWLKERRSG